MESLQKAVDKARSSSVDIEETRSRKPAPLDNRDSRERGDSHERRNSHEQGNCHERSSLDCHQHDVAGSIVPEAEEQILENAALDNVIPGEPATAASDLITPLHNLQYTQTRQVACSTETLLRHRVICDAQPDVVVAPYNILRTQILQTMRAKGWNSLAVVSPNDDEGRTLTAINLAIAIAKEVNQTVLLADFDLQRPSINQYFGFSAELGILDYVTRGTPLDRILVNPGTERLVILPGRESIANSSEMLVSPSMVRLTTEIKNRYPSRLVIFDLPPLLTRDDAIAFAPYIDAFLLVFEEGKTSKSDIIRASTLIKDKPVLGTVLNKA